MSSTEDYQAKLAEIEAISEEETKSPNMPVDIFLQEAENTYQWVQADKEKLTAAGLDWTLVDDLPVRASAEREDANTERIIRDKAFTYTKQALDEIRECGQYVFWRDEARHRGYISNYKKRHRKKISSVEA